MKTRLLRCIPLLLAAFLAARAPGQGVDPEQDPDQQPDEPEGGGAQPAEPPALAPDDEIRLDAFATGVELPNLVKYVAEALGINVSVDSGLTGSVVFNVPVTVRRDELLPLLDALLEQHNYTITQDNTGWFHVQQMTTVPVMPGGELPTTRIVRTPNVKPSALQQAVQAQVQGVSGGRISYIDDLGVIVVTDTPRRAQAVVDLVESLLAEREPMRYMRFDLKYVSASSARTRALELLGARAQQVAQAVPGRPDPTVRTGGTDVLTNLSERLMMDAQGNALIFRGVESEGDEIRAVLDVIDTPNTLEPRTYEVGSAAAQITAIAQQRGLGEVTALESLDPLSQVQARSADPRFQQLTQPEISIGGPTMVVDEAHGRIVYYATPEQHEQLDALINQLNIEDEVVVVQVYKLHHQSAEDVEAILLGLLDNVVPQRDESSLMSAAMRPGRTTEPATPARARAVNQEELGEGQSTFTGGPDVFVLADIANNQILVKAPRRQQAEFEKLIAKLDLRRPQVYLQAKIVAVTWTDEFRLAFETQVVNAGGDSGAINVNYGLKSFLEGTDLTDAAVVSTGLGGLTAAIIRNEYVPIVINALQKEVNGRILASPQLLVDDNEEAEIASIEQQPTSTTTTGQTTDYTSFGEYVEAGTTLVTTPHISEGFLRLEYEINLSNFVGQGTGGIPPPKFERKVRSAAVTIPSDTTIVVGGITIDERSDTVVKIPFLGDIPIIGPLFSDTSYNDRKTTLYVFITPRIVQDPMWADPSLLTAGPQAEVGLDPDIPTLEPTLMEVIQREVATQPVENDAIIRRQENGG